MLQAFARSPDEIRSDNLQAWVSTIEGVTPLDQIEARRHMRVAGVIQNIRIDPREGSGSIEARLIDGTGSLIAKWLGRQQLSGIRLGMGLVLEGIVGQSKSGENVILNPDYRLVPGPEHG
jgi:hypothetical protein